MVGVLSRRVCSDSCLWSTLALNITHPSCTSSALVSHEPPLPHFHSPASEHTLCHTSHRIAGCTLHANAGATQSHRLQLVHDSGGQCRYEPLNMTMWGSIAVLALRFQLPSFVEWLSGGEERHMYHGMIFGLSQYLRDGRRVHVGYCGC